MKVLLTGGTGMVGRNVLEHVKAREFEVLAPGRAELDLTNYESVQQYVAHHRPDAIIHAAGRVGGIAANIAEPVRFLVENWDIGRNVVLAAHAARVPHLLNLASSCVYPRNAANPLSEDLILTGELEPTNEGYALAKISVLRLCRYVMKQEPSFSYKTLVPCNLYGRYDHFNPATAHLVAAIIEKTHRALLAREPSVEIWGDGTARREFMYAADLADCIWRSVDGLETIPDVMNVGTGIDHSVNEYYRAVADVIGYRGSFVHDLTRPAGMQRKLVNADRAKEWGWSAATPLEEGLRSTYAYYCERVVSAAV